MTPGYEKMSCIWCAERRHLREPGAPLTHLLFSHTYGVIPGRTSWALVAKSTVMVSREKEALLHVSHLA